MEQEKKLDLKKILDKISHTPYLIVILLIGIMLLIASGSLLKSGKQQAAKTGDTKAKPSDTASYTSELEQKLKTILSGVEGVGTVDVMITLADTGQNVLAYDEKSQSKGSGAQSASTGEATPQDKQTDSKLVLRSEGGSQAPVTVKEILPQVSGVLIVADGGNNSSVKNNIISAVRAVLDVKLNKVCVVGREQGK